MADLPSRNDGVTMACPRCGAGFLRTGRQRFCSAACRQAVWRSSHATPPPTLPPRVPRADTVYECPACAARFLGAQRCPDCHQFCRRVGPGGSCPHCGEPIAVADLIVLPEGGASRTT